METMPDKICAARCRKGYTAFDEVSRPLEADEALYHHDRVVQGLQTKLDKAIHALKKAEIALFNGEGFEKVQSLVYKTLEELE
jgi:hypothetical protein